jgi:hypothetical protein
MRGIFKIEESLCSRKVQLFVTDSSFLICDPEKLYPLEDYHCFD